MDRPGAATGLAAEQPQLPTITDYEGAYQPVDQLMGGVQGPPAGSHGQECRIVRTAGGAAGRLVSRCRSWDPPSASRLACT
jgi:hypothetical protein